MRKIMALFLSFVLLFTFSGCETVDESAPDFSEWLEANHQEIYEEGDFVLDGLGEVVSLTLEKEESFFPSVVLSFRIYEPPFSSSPKTIKNGLRDICEYVFEYAQYCEWDNDYNLYVCVQYFFDVSYYVTYYCETDELYIPSYKTRSLLSSAYDKFGTLDDEEICKTREGVNWLIENGLGYMKHNQFEFSGWGKYDNSVGYYCYISNNELKCYSLSEIETY